MGARLGGRGDLAAGCVAVVVLAFLVLVLRLHLLLAVVLAIATYLGCAFMRIPDPSRLTAQWRAMLRDWRLLLGKDVQEATPEERTYATAFARAQALRALGFRIAKPAVHNQVDLIVDRIDQIMTVMAEDGDLSQIPVLDSCLLEPLFELLATYLRIVERGVQSAGEVLARIESHDLPLIREAVDDFYERLHSRQLTDLATMSELIEFNLESVRAMMRRRGTP